MVNSEKSIKIIFAGLDEGGKTSILNALKKKNYALDDIKPTKGINRLSLKVLDVSFNEFDLGGQEMYRKIYLQKKEAFYNTDLLFYVIDISAPERYSDALDYYKSIVEILSEREERPTVVVLFHKIDKIEKIKEEQVQNVQNSILNISIDLDLEFFRTSIFEPQTLMNAYSHGINRISKQTSELSAQLKEMAAETFADAILLTESNGFIIGEYAKDDESREMLMNVYNYLIGAFSYMYKSLAQTDKPERILIDWEDKGHSFLDSTEIDNLEFFFIKYTSNPRKVVQKFVLRSLIQSSKQIRNIIKSYFD
ncbi:MAG: 50S ribosome-binding GTPase [Candidatus Helarchaeota archaeon]|nr:50S ribosome-binding GTPase [Candidatus Helarchaeota archaeon]